MTKFEKRLCVFAVVFVAIYIGAVVITVRSRMNDDKRITRIESAEPGPAEGRLMLAELLLPMLILLTLTVSFIIVKKQRAKKMLRLEESDKGDENGKSSF